MIFNVTGGGGGTGCTLTITAPVGATVTVSKNGKAKPSKVATTGTVVFKGLETGAWTLTITNGTDTATKTVEIKADYEANITFFTATLHISYPAGLACTATDGVTTLTAPDTSGTWACVVPNKGTWAITAGEWSGEVVITATGQTKNVRLAKWIVKNGVVQTDIGLATQLISGRTPTVVQGDGYTQFTATKSGEANGILSDNAIDMEKVKTIIADINILTVGTSGSNAKFAGITLALTQSTKYTTLDKAGAAITHYMVGNTAGRQKLSIDAANITGDWYVGFAIGVKGDFRVYDLRVEV